MNKKLKEAIEVVDKLNSLLDEKTLDRFTLVYNTTGVIIGFGDITLWFSEDDQREFIDDLIGYEPLIDFIRKEFRRYVTELCIINHQIGKK